MGRFSRTASTPSDAQRPARLGFNLMRRGDRKPAFAAATVRAWLRAWLRRDFMYNLVWQRHVCQASADASWWENQMQHPTDPQTTVHFAKTCRTGYGLTTVGLRPSSVRPSPAPFASRAQFST